MEDVEEIIKGALSSYRRSKFSEFGVVREVGESYRTLVLFFFVVFIIKYDFICESNG